MKAKQSLSLELKEGEALEDLLHGQLKLIQPCKGYRYSADALLLAAFSLEAAAGKDVLDLGCGSGVIALILAARARPRSVTAVEIQSGLADMACRSAALNRTEPPVKIVRANALAPGLFPAASFDLAISNPPFRPANSGRQSQDPEKALARHEIAMNLKDWLHAAARLLRADGRICLVYPVDRETKLRAVAAEQKLHPARIQYALDRPGGARKLVLFELVKNPAELLALPDVPIETPEGKFSLDGYR
jgi:tRNA1Val (adenine37-N6)-methyltransferase